MAYFPYPNRGLGAYTLVEYIIMMIDKCFKICAALIDECAVYYFMHDENSKDKLPKTNVVWREKLKVLK